MPRSARNVALRHRAEDGRARRFAARASAAKSTCAERSASPGLSSTSAKRCSRHGLQGFAEAAIVVIAVVDDQRARRRCARSTRAISFRSRVAAGETSYMSPIRRVARVRRNGQRPARATARKRARRSHRAPTMRSHQPRAVYTNWRIGSASKNSLASRNSGRSASDSSNCVQPSGLAARARLSAFSACDAAAPRLVSTSTLRARREIPASRFAARSTSAIKVPRPGPEFDQPAGAGCPDRARPARTTAPATRRTSG